MKCELSVCVAIVAHATISPLFVCKEWQVVAVILK